MPDAVSVLSFLGLAAAAVLVFRAYRTRRLAIERLERQGPDVLAYRGRRVRSSMLRQRRWLPFAIGAAAGSVMLSIGANAVIALGAAALAGVASDRFQDIRYGQRVGRFEAQLSEALDLIVGTLRAGGGLADAFAAAADETREPLGPLLDEAVDRIRLGDEPTAVFLDLEDRVPLESFRLFTFTLSAHWQGGASLASSLGSIGTTIRDRIALARRVRSQSVEAQASVYGILVLTYGVGIVLWRANPERVSEFVQTGLGAFFVGGAVILQAVGLQWMASIAKIDI